MAVTTYGTRPPDVQQAARGAADVWAGGQRLLARSTAKAGRASWVLPASGGWTWRGSALLTVVLLHPYLLVLAVRGSGTDLGHTAGTMSLLLVQISVLASAAVLKYDWRINRRAGVGWLAMALAFMAGQHVPFALLAVQGARQGTYGYVVGVTQLPSAAVLLAMVVLARRGARMPTANPLTTGLVLGGLLGAARFALIDAGLDPSLRLDHGTGTVLLGGLLVLAAAIATVLAGDAALPAWVRSRVVVFVACTIASRALSHGHVNDAPSPLAVAVAALGAVALFSTAAVMLRRSIDQGSERLVELARRAASAEVSVRHGRERMHELHATVAGVAQASRLMLHHGNGLRGERRRRLEDLLEAEMGRLERMLAQRDREPVRELSVDDVLLPLVETRRMLGMDVHLVPSGLRAVGRPDDLAEAAHVLLSNAARHAPDAAVEVVPVLRGGTVEIRVSDDGPGIPDQLRTSLFQWGARARNSPGQGIGLQLARRLMQEQAGSLTLEEEGRPGGATFILSIPASPPGLT